MNVHNSFQHFFNLENGVLAEQLHQLRAAAVLNPLYLERLSTNEPCDMITDFTSFAWADDNMVEALLDELPAMRQLCDDHFTETDEQILYFWYQQRANTDVETWHNAFLHVASMAPTSAAVERLFSYLQRAFSDSQTLALRDYVETSVKLRYNKRHL